MSPLSELTDELRRASTAFGSPPTKPRDGAWPADRRSSRFGEPTMNEES